MYSVLMNILIDGCGSFLILLCFYKKIYIYSIFYSIWCIYINVNCYFFYFYNKEVV